MLELPEAEARARQLNETLGNRKIATVEIGASPHRFAFYSAEPEEYRRHLVGRHFSGARGLGGQLEFTAGDYALAFSDGVNLRWLPAGERPPATHQLLIHFEHGSALAGTIQMYGFLTLFPKGGIPNDYYRVALEKPSPLTDRFSESYFMGLLDQCRPKLKIKAVLATEQRIPGLGNGVLQDILFNARIHPKSELAALSQPRRRALFHSVKRTLTAMAAAGGRDTEKDLFGRPGGYRTLLSANTRNRPCPICGGPITRQALLGGNVYFCAACQPL